MNRLAITFGVALLCLSVGFGGVPASAKDRAGGHRDQSGQVPPPGQINHFPGQAGHFPDNGIRCIRAPCDFEVHRTPANHDARKRAAEAAGKRRGEKLTQPQRYRFVRERMRANARAKAKADGVWLRSPFM